MEPLRASSVCSDISSPPTSAAEPTQELATLPRSNGLLRSLTAFLLGLTLLASAAMALGLRHDAAFTLTAGAPRDLGELGKVRPSAEMANQWVRAEAVLADVSLDYRRPFDASTFRLIPVPGDAQIFVQVEVLPNAGEFIMPSSFVGRLLPLTQLGVNHLGLKSALEARFGSGASSAWVLLDGEGPVTNRWVLGFAVLCLGFFVFSALGLVTLFWPRLRLSHAETKTQAA